MIVSVMKTTFQKSKSRIVSYGDYTKFFNDDFKQKNSGKLIFKKYKY